MNVQLYNLPNDFTLFLVFCMSVYITGDEKKKSIYNLRSGFG